MFYKEKKKMEFPQAEIIGFVGDEIGVIIAFSDDGQRALFASKQMQPLRWIEINTFIADPKAIPSAEEMIESEVEDDD